MTKITLCIIIASLALFANSFDNGSSLLKEGKLSDATNIISAAYKKTPSSPNITFLNAKLTRNGKMAQKSFQAIAENIQATDSIRSEAYYHIGLFCLAKNNYSKAEQAFSQSVTFHANSRKLHYKSLATYRAGNNKSAETIWISMLSHKVYQEDRLKTLYYLGNLYYARKKYSQAINCYNKASQSSKNIWNIPALAGVCLSSFNNKNNSPSTILYEQILNSYPDMLEKKLLISGIHNSHDPEKPENSTTEEDFGSIERSPQINNNSVPFEKNSGPKPVVSIKKGEFTLQIGAFGSQDNADKLAKKMKKHFDNVSIKIITIDPKVFHKVRVGLFGSEFSALEFGSEHLKTNDISYRVVQK